MKDRKLTAENYNKYLEKVYASWLGKVIGVRLGAPIENWSNTQIEEKYGQLDNYPVDYGIFAADDDTNGPLFFVRALLNKKDISAKDVGDAFLNYIQEYSGFFWWGGVGVSSEHTAYENLKNKISAPASGSMKTNGSTIAEQIGGQIFSDCWAYVSGYDVKLAKDLAIKAASVTHDGNGIQGAIFVAAAITIAYQSDDIHEVLKEALTHLDKRMKYYQVAQDIIRFYQKYPYDYQKCLQYIFANYGYDKYPGVCHIIPNSALMIMAMCYGENDFSKTLCILAESGWDTDCNCGNVGSIMGALKGLKGIDEKWILPNNDIVNASSCIGYLNIQTISESAQLFAQLAMKLKGLRIPEYNHFLLPYATEGFFSDKQTLKVNEGLELEDEEIHHYAYYLPDDIYDARYDPVFSPLLYPGDELYFEMWSEAEAAVSIFIEDCELNRYYSETFIVEGPETITYRIPAKKNLFVHLFGLKVQEQCKLRSYQIIPHHVLNVDFKELPIDAYGPRYAGDKLYNIRGFNPHSGTFTLEKGKLCNSANDHSLITTGNIANEVKELSMAFTAENKIDAYLVCGFRGYMSFDAIGIRNNELLVLRKSDKYRRLKTVKIDEIKTGQVRLRICFNQNETVVYINGNKYILDYKNPPKGAVGILCLNDAKIKVSRFSCS